MKQKRKHPSTFRMARVHDTRPILVTGSSTALSNASLELDATFCLMVPDITNSFFSDMARGVIRQVRVNRPDYHVLIVSTEENPEIERTHLELLLKAKGISGIIASPVSTRPEPWQDLANHRMPVVFVDREVSPIPEGAEVVRIDNYQGAYVGAHHLLELGHRRIGFLCGPTQASTFSERLRGFRAALETTHVSCDPLLELIGPLTRERGTEMCLELLALSPPPTAIFASNNVHGQAALLKIQEQGIPIPGEISLLMFDDAPWATLTSPKVSVIEQPAADLGAVAVEKLLRRLGLTQAGPSDLLSLVPRLVHRGSCRFPHPGAWMV